MQIKEFVINEVRWIALNNLVFYPGRFYLGAKLVAKYHGTYIETKQLKRTVFQLPFKLVSSDSKFVSRPILLIKCQPEERIINIAGSILLTIRHCRGSCRITLPCCRYCRGNFRAESAQPVSMVTGKHCVLNAETRYPNLICNIML